MTEPDPDVNGVRDFTIKRDPHQFRIDDDVFKAPAIISPIALTKLSKLHGEMGDAAQISANIEATLQRVGDMFTILLPGPSGQRFKQRLLSEEEPIDLQQQALPALYWLLERYGMRPTQPSSPSPDGSTDGTTTNPTDNTSSTDGASNEASNGEPLTLPTG
jgi:hypothetical protein